MVDANVNFSNVRIAHQMNYFFICVIQTLFISLFCIPGRTRVFRRRGERFAEVNIVETDQYGGGSVMVWGGISLHSKTDLVTIQGRLNAQQFQGQIVRPHILPHIRTNGPMIRKTTPRVMPPELPNSFLLQTMCVFCPGLHAART